MYLLDEMGRFIQFICLLDEMGHGDLCEISYAWLQSRVMMLNE